MVCADMTIKEMQCTYILNSLQFVRKRYAESVTSARLWYLKAAANRAITSQYIRKYEIHHINYSLEAPGMQKS